MKSKINNIPMRIATLSVAIVIVATLSVGCLNLPKKAYPQITEYQLSAGDNKSQQAHAAPGVTLLVRGLRAAPAVNRKNIVWKKGSNAYEADFHHRFFVPPAENITAELIAWLQDGNVTAAVIDSASLQRPTHVIEGRLISLYGDQSKKTAHLELRLTLLDVRKANAQLLAEKKFTFSKMLEDGKAESLIPVWNAMLASAFTEWQTVLQNTLNAKK
jgi:ABC-type uncharacterized transport system auxiliary subunit